MKRNVIYFSVTVVFLCSLLFLIRETPAWASDREYLPVNGPCNLIFPRAHRAHPGYRVEWWYYTGNLATSRGERHGFQLTFFRTQISPPGAEKGWPPNQSAWRTNQLFFAHVALSDGHPFSLPGGLICVLKKVS